MSQATAERPASRGDARAKATGATLYTADFDHSGALHVAVVRSDVPSGKIASVDRSAAEAVPGVVGVLLADDLPGVLCGRRVRDMPLIARGVIRYAGERVAVVVADTRAAAETAASLVEVDITELPAVFDPVDALDEAAPRVHEAPWSYPGAVVTEVMHPNLQSLVEAGDPDATAKRLSESAFSVEATYTIPSTKQGYLEPQAWLAVPQSDGSIRLRGTTKSPYRLREQVSTCLGLSPGELEVEPTPLGGDFGGKGAPGDAPLCVALARRFRRPVRLVLRSAEDLTATDARHPARVTVRIGCDPDGRLTAMSFDAVFAGGAYASHKPGVTVNLHGAVEAALGYKLPAWSTRSRVVYTNTVPKGHMRAPGATASVFAIESALDELAVRAGIDPAALRAANLLGDGDRDAYGHSWEQARGAQTLEAALAALVTSASVPVPAGWSSGTGITVYCRPTSAASTSLRLIPASDGSFVVEVPIPETGTGNHMVVRELLARALGVSADLVEVRQVATSQLPGDPGVGGSRVTVGMAVAVEELARRWAASEHDGAVEVESKASYPPVLSYAAQIARVAVDPDTGQVKVLELLSAVDVARVVNPVAHQLQIDGGAVMGFGSAVMEDSLEQDGLVWAANLGELKLPCAADVPRLTTILLEGGLGIGDANVKSVGELTNVAVPAAVANAVANAVWVRVRDLPVSAEKVWHALQASESGKVAR
jgi:CO/xanthine dehydrogenase Mo-binding subunit